MGVTFIAKEGTYTAPATLTTKTITENGTYSAVDDSANGYSSVTVEVEGGGGSSDFSTAQVTVTRAQSKTITLPYLYDGEASALMSYVFDSGEYTAVLYKGVCIASALDLENPMLTPTIVVTGNATVDGGDIIITGDCTITIS